jgi:hypothetical protein
MDHTVKETTVRRTNTKNMINYKHI